jgi:excisionase family DNA binding protein
MARRKPIPHPDDLLTMREACERYKVGRSSIYRWADDGLISLYKVGGSTRVDRVEVEARVIRRVVAS